MARKSINGFQIEFSFYNTRIHHSYLMCKKQEIKDIVKEIIKERKKLKLPITRSEKSYIKEIKAHNMLYFLGMLRDRTQHTDLEEHINSFKEIIYFILGA